MTAVPAIIITHRTIGGTGQKDFSDLVVAEWEVVVCGRLCVCLQTKRRKQGLGEKMVALEGVRRLRGGD